MPRTKRTLTEDEVWEQEVDDAVEGIKNGRYSGFRQAARETGLSRTTITEWYNGRSTRRKAQEKQMKLAHVEEDELARAIRVATVAGKPPLSEVVRGMADGLMKRRVKRVNEDGNKLVSYEPIGKKWPSRFIKRQKQLKSERAEKIEVVRNEVKVEDLEKWFTELAALAEKYDIQPGNIYNMDESGFNVGNFEARQVIVDTSVQSRYQAQAGWQEWVTAVECICADGSSVPPLIIFTGETFVRQWVPANFDSTWKFSNNTKGWTSEHHAVEWFTKCFEPATREKANGQYRLLICDGHGSHTTPEFLAHAIEHQILVVLLIPHSSHLAQPLDATIFGPLKRILSGITTSIFQLGMSKMPKDEWIEAYYKAHYRAFSIKSIKAGFSSTGIYPFNPDKVLNRIRSMPDLPVTPSPRSPLQVPTIPTSTAITDTTGPFPPHILTSSPFDFSSMQSANSIFNRMIEAKEPLSTPARIYARTVTTGIEKLYARTSILEERTEAQGALLAKRKERESVKRSVIKGKFLISTPEIHAERKAEKQHTTQNKRRKCTSHHFLTDLVAPEIDPNLELPSACQAEGEISDCIVVHVI